MRLTNFEAKIIKTTAEEIFGNGSKVILFGSRVDDTKRGGDIDLYIMPSNKDNLFEKKIRFIAKLWGLIGEQKVDVVIAENKDRKIENEAIEKGVKL